MWKDISRSIAILFFKLVCNDSSSQYKSQYYEEDPCCLWTAHVPQIIFSDIISLNFPPNHKAEIQIAKAEDRSLVQRLYIYIQSLTSFRFWWSFPACTNMRRVPSQALQRMLSCSRLNQWDAKGLTGDKDILANTSSTIRIASRWVRSYSIQGINLIVGEST